MKKLFLTSMALLAMMSAMTFTSCSDDDNNDNPGGGGDEPTAETIELGGVVEGTMELDATKEYRLTATLTVPEGAVLEIPAGTTIKAAQGFDKYILVEQGGKINARGTADKPIVFTADADNATSGYWGGLIINGYARISGAAEGSTGATEIDTNQPYGGTDDTDNSGTLEYVELWYTGARSTADIEHNGLTLNGVGNGTKIENIYIAEGADDAIEFFGGSVNVTNLLAVNCDDDCFDFTQGYCGTLKNCYGRWEAGFTSTEEDPRGVEADGNLDGDGPDHTPQADFRIENMTIENLSTSQAMQDAIKVRRGAKATIENALVKGSGVIEELVDLTDKKGNAADGTAVTVSTEATNVEKDTNDGNPAGATVNIASGNTGCDTGIFGWTGYSL